MGLHRKPITWIAVAALQCKIAIATLPKKSKKKNFLDGDRLTACLKEH